MPVFDADMTERSKAAYVAHEMHEAPSRSFLFRKPGTSNMHFRFTWAPGSITITGDVGELNIVHHNALWEFEGGIYWLKGSDPDYLFGKCPGVKPEYDFEATLAYVKEHLNRPVIEALNGHEHWMPRDKAGNKMPRVPGYRQELQRWRRAVKREREEGIPEEELEERPENEKPSAFSRKAGWDDQLRIDARKASNRHDPFDYWHVPDAWEPWVRLWLWDHGRQHWHPSETYGRPDEVLKREVRVRLLEELESGLTTDQSAAIDILQGIGFEDYYGSERYSPSLAFLYEASQFAAREIAASFTHTWGDPVC